MRRLALGLLALVLGGVAGAQTTAPQVTAALGQGELQVSFAIPAGLHQTLQRPYFGVTVDPASLPPGLRLGEEVFPPAPQVVLGLPSYEGTVIVRLPLVEENGFQPSAFTLRGRVRWQLCYDDGVCLVPASADFSLAVQPARGLGLVAPATPVPTAGPPGGDLPAGVFDLGPPLWLVLVLALAGGALLNLMPCVLPVLTLKVVALLRHSAQDRRQRRRHAWASSAGILSSLWILAAVLIGLQAAGNAVGWGVQFQNPWYVLGITVVVLVFALSLFDVVQIGTPAVRAGRTSGLTGSFTSGLLTVVLATPCTAPFLGPALGVAFASSWWVILLVFTAVGVGLALPFFLVLTIPGTLDRLPKPGPWMDTLRAGLGFALVGTAIWLLSVLLAQTSSASFVGVLWFLGLVAALTWSWGQVQRTSWGAGVRRTAGAVLVVLLLAGGGVLVRFSPAEPPAAGTWLPFSEPQVQSLLAAGRPVFVDFTAAWCLTCQVNEAGPLADPAVLAAFAQKNVALVRGDYTNADPTITAWLQRYHRAGVPFSALLKSGREPVVLSELLTKDEVVGALGRSFPPR